MEMEGDIISTGVSLITELISKNRTKVDEVHWFCFDSCSSDLRSQSSMHDSCSSCFMHDCFPSRLDCKEFIGEDINKIVSNYESKKMIIIIDSFSTLLDESDSIEAYELLQKMYWKQNDGNNNAIQIFLIFRNGASLNAIQTAKQLQPLIKTWLTIRSDSVMVKTVKSSGKLVTQVYQYHINDDGKLFLDVRKHSVPHSIKTTERKVDDLVLCTFKMDLTEQEKEARNAVDLPYINRSDGKKEMVSNAQIHYTPDEYDDWDEEEPDYDLEFF